MNPETEAALAALRGLHWPAGQDGFLAGDVAAAALLGLGAALLVGLVRNWRARHRTSLRRAALRELARAGSLDADGRLVAQARLLRRLVRTLKGEDAATGRGEAWAATLDATFATDFFTRGAGQAFAEGLYRRPQASDVAAIDAGLHRLVARIGA